MIYVVLPIYNEAKNVRVLIGQLRHILPPSPYRIIAVDDGSTDRTLETLKELTGKDLQVENYRLNMNVGAAFATGIDAVLSQAKSNDVMVIMESDGTSDIRVLPALIAKITEDSYDVAIASRYIPGGGYAHFPFQRRIISSLANTVLRFLFPMPGVRDYTIFYRAYRVGVLRHMQEYFGRFGIIRTQGFVANAELLAKLSFFTKRMTEVPFFYDYGKKRGESKMNIFLMATEYFVTFSYLRRIRDKINHSS